MFCHFQHCWFILATWIGLSKGQRPRGNYPFQIATADRHEGSIFYASEPQTSKGSSTVWKHLNFTLNLSWLNTIAWLAPRGWVSITNRKRVWEWFVVSLGTAKRKNKQLGRHYQRKLALGNRNHKEPPKEEVFQTGGPDSSAVQDYSF